MNKNHEFILNFAIYIIIILNIQYYSHEWIKKHASKIIKQQFIKNLNSTDSTSWKSNIKTQIIISHSKTKSSTLFPFYNAIIPKLQ